MALGGGGGEGEGRAVCGVEVSIFRRISVEFAVIEGILAKGFNLRIA